MIDAVRAYDFPKILENAPEGLRYLSLDCFDTLIWRNVQAPHDVFADLPITGGGVRFRTIAEYNARKDQKFNRGYHEVPIEQIYARLFPAATDREIAAAVQAELDAEARHCFAFAPTVQLMRDAKSRGLKIIIVSDTYLNERQLRDLIQRAAGDDVESMIDHVFCSCEHRAGKAEGLFAPVLEALKTSASSILHLGDNLNADRVAPAKLGIHAIHFQQFDTEAAARFRLEAAAVSVLDSKVRECVPAFQPHRACIALSSGTDAAARLGHDVVGPVMHAFASWIRDEVAELERQTGTTPHVLFLLRDGHLPMRAFQALYGDIGAPVEISRFTSVAASLTDVDAIRAYLLSAGKTDRTEIMGDQLLLSRPETATMSRQFGLSPHEAFVRAALKPEMVRTICERSRDFADRLFAHLKTAADVQEGSTVMFVDLGYAGTVQNKIEPVLRERFGLKIAGRYLLLREEDQRGLDKKGMIDCRHYDLRAVNALCGPISVMEQLCTIEQGSVVDYEPDGSPIRKKAGLKGGQSTIRAEVQKACLNYVNAAESAWLNPPASYGGDCRRTMAAAILGRLLFLPTQSELTVFDAFEHDVNLGTQDMVKLLDVKEAGTALRRRGLAYLNNSMRMYLPGELQPHGLPLNLALLNSVRFGLDLRTSDFDVGGIDVQILIADEKSQAIVGAKAFPTHDGYYQMRIPVGAGRFSVGIQIGRACEWVQVDQLVFLPEAAFGEVLPGEMPEPIPAEPLYDEMEQMAEGLFRCGPNALLFVSPPPSDGPLVLSLTFRPVKWVRDQALQAAA